MHRLSLFVLTLANDRLPAARHGFISYITPGSKSMKLLAHLGSSSRPLLLRHFSAIADTPSSVPMGGYCAAVSPARQSLPPSTLSYLTWTLFVLCCWSPGHQSIGCQTSVGRQRSSPKPQRPEIQTLTSTPRLMLDCLWSAVTWHHPPTSHPSNVMSSR